MPDERLRELERRWRQGGEYGPYLREAVRRDCAATTGPLQDRPIALYWIYYLIRVTLAEGDPPAERGHLNLVVGTIVRYASVGVPVIPGWLPCDGRLVTRTEYPELGAVLVPPGDLVVFGERTVDVDTPGTFRLPRIDPEFGGPGPP